MPKSNALEKDSLEELYVEQLRELYSAELQSIDALPEMTRAVHDPKLKAAFEHHLEQTYQHLERIEQLLEDLDQSPAGHKSDTMKGLVTECRKIIRSETLASARDAALIDIAQCIEHYEIASYGCVRIYASLLRDDEAADLLQTTLNEEAEMDRELMSVAEALNVEC